MSNDWPDVAEPGSAGAAARVKERKRAEQQQKQARAEEQPERENDATKRGREERQRARDATRSAGRDARIGSVISPGTTLREPPGEDVSQSDRHEPEDLEGASATGQLALAYAFARANVDALVYVYGVKRWHVWDGTRWREDTAGVAEAAVVEMLRTEYAAAFGDTARSKVIQQQHTASGVRGILELARVLPGMGVPFDSMDANPFLLNTPSATLDLATMCERPHEPRDYLTAVTRGSYRVGLSSPLWDDFLAEMLPDAEVRAFVQRLLGSALVGRVREHVFPVLIGPGANGKGVTYKSALHALGDYGLAADADLFVSVKSNANAAAPAVMRLRGKRLVVTSETEQDAPLAVAFMKRLTGGDTIAARPLYGEQVEWEPTHTAVLVTNNEPKIRGDDPAVWRRVVVVPFSVTKPEDQQDHELGEKLQDEADAVLTWMVQGYRLYRQRGLDAPEAVRVRTKAYQTSSDTFALFVSEECVTGSPALSVSGSVLWRAWQEWCAAAGERADQYGGRTKFFELVARHYEDTSARGHKSFGGLTVRSHGED